MRGKVYAAVSMPDTVGITPAYAGKSPAGFSLYHARWDHPRLCGEKLHNTFRIHRQMGSPPPMRGKAIGVPSSQYFRRITPAYAGKRILYRIHLNKK